MYQIGFATKYFTLWDVNSSIEYTGNSGEYSYDVTRYTFIQNLSLNEDKAKEKAKKWGVGNLEVNTDLYGRSGRSFQTSKRVEVKYEDYQFTFGKYEGGDIRENTDISYLQWYYKEKNQLVVAERICELDDFFSIKDGELLNKDELANRIKTEKIENELFKTGVIELEVPKNIDSMGFLFVDGVIYHFNEIAQRDYKGWDYYLPVLNGNAKRIKNKTIEVTVEYGSIYGWKAWMVKDFKIIKK